MFDVNKFEAMRVGLASPEKIRSWSYGEVKKPETINYRTLKPERDGLFCERIFGPTKDYECSCGKYKRVRFKGVVCDRCGVEVTKAKVRRERMGHIELAAPVTHIWYFKGIPSRMGLVLDMSPRDLEEIIYFVSYVVINPGPTSLEKKQLLQEKEYRAYYEKYGNSFKVGMGAEAIKTLLEDVDLEKEKNMIETALKTAQGQKRSRLLKRLEVIDAFYRSNNRPEWMVMDVLPVIPPELRPMIQLDGGRFATSDLNDLYRRVINRNNRLKKLLDLGAPNIIVQNEKRMLQEAVDALIDNGRRGRAVTGPGNRPLKSLTHMLKGKQGRFRQNLLGKRVDYSGRSVIVVGPDLKMYQCGIPKEMALELFTPHIIRELVERELAHNIKSAKRMIANKDESVWDIVEEVIREHPVLLNRAPTLHRLGIQAFEPKLVEGRAIRLHPLVTPAFNADFDGDQMAVHVPLGEQAQAEARLLMLGASNILNPKDGKPVVTPSQDMVLGNYYLTLEKVGLPGEGRVFKSLEEANMAYQIGDIHLHSRIAIPAAALNNATFTEEQMKCYVRTTLGKLIFNDIMPEGFPYINEPSNYNITTATPEEYFIKPGENIREIIRDAEVVSPFKKKTLGIIISEIFKRFKTTETSIMLDKLKDLGFKYSTVAGFTVALSDVKGLDNKNEIIARSDEAVEKIRKAYNRGRMTDQERYRKVIDIWTKTKAEIYDGLQKSLNEKHKENSIFMMMDSGARGNISNFGQLAGMRGLMAKPNGESIEIPIKSAFMEGLTVSEFFTSTHGARKGLADTALKTADSGYLTRRLVDVAQDVIVREVDCGTDEGLKVSSIINTKDNTIIESLERRIIGRYANKKVVHPETGEVLVQRNDIITEMIAAEIMEAGIEEVEIRSVLSCSTSHGVCQKCYGRNLATGEVVEIGEAIGIMAAQSIGEPGTQLTMRTFHTGGVAGDDITQGLPRVQELFEARNPKARSIISEIRGNVEKIEQLDHRYEITVKNELEDRTYLTPYSARLRVKEGQNVQPGQKLTEGSIDPKELLKVTDVRSVQSYILKEIQKVYSMQGVEISDKHVEVMSRRMLSKLRIIDPGSTPFLPGALVDMSDFTRENRICLSGGKNPAIGRPVLLGITKASLETESFLSAASFQETTRVLTDAAIKGKTDHLMGLKENVIIGKLIPAGTGAKMYRDVDLKIDRPEVEVDLTEFEEIVE